MNKVDWVDSDGIKRRSLLPDKFATPEEGIPADVYDILDANIQLSDTLRVKFFHELWVRGLVEKTDFAKRDAQRTVRQALQSALSKDAQDIVNIVIGS